MAIYIGQSTKDQAAIRVGLTNIGKVYVGDKLVWPSAPDFTPVENGLLYNYYTGIDPRQIAPIGYRMPVKADFNTLLTTVGGALTAGNKLKDKVDKYWIGLNTDITNEFGMNVRAAGSRQYDGLYGGLLNYEYYLCVDAPFLLTGNYFAYRCKFMWNDNNVSVSFDTGNYLAQGISYRFIKEDSVNSGFVIDNSGYKYPTVKIGNQVWTACNARTEHFRNGDIIPYVATNSAWASLITPGRCYPNGNILNV